MAALKAALLTQPKPYVKVGLLGGAKADRPGDELTNPELGAIHEFGAPSVDIPERSFIRAPFHAHRKEYVELLRALLKKSLKNSEFTPHKALAVVGEKMAADFKRSAPGTPPPNAEVTLAKKLGKGRAGSLGDAKTLVDTGRMVNSISYEVVNE